MKMGFEWTRPVRSSNVYSGRFPKSYDLNAILRAVVALFRIGKKLGHDYLRVPDEPTIA